MASEPLIVTIDGPAGSGKSTIAMLAARRLGLPCLNSGAIYRAVTLAVVETGERFDDAGHVRAVTEGLDFEIRDDGDALRHFVGGRDVTHRLKDPEITSQVYRIADVPEYRKLLIERQRRFAAGRGVVAEGRDMGTVIFPDATVKVFLDAPADDRARRQHLELIERGVDASYEDVLGRLRERDLRDRSRAVAPLLAAPDAVHVDTGGRTIAEVLEVVLGIVGERCRGGSRAGRQGARGR